MGSVGTDLRRLVFASSHHGSVLDRFCSIHLGSSLVVARASFAEGVVWRFVYLTHWLKLVQDVQLADSMKREATAPSQATAPKIAKSEPELAADEDGARSCTLAEGPGEWLSLEYGDVEIWVHPPTRRVCASPEGDLIGEFDSDSHEVRLFAADAESWGAVEMKDYPGAATFLAGEGQWIREFSSSGLLCLAADRGMATLGKGLVEGIRTELEVMLSAGLFAPLREQSCGKNLVAYLYTRAAENNTNAYAELLEARPCPPCCFKAISLLEGLAYAMDQHLNLGILCPRRCLATCYESGHHYTSHVDNTVDPETGVKENSRALTAILYLNDVDWSAEQGGQLRCHIGGNASSADTGTPTTAKVVDVLPRGGQIVMFDSCCVLHEVLPSSTRRFALQMWFVAA